MFFKRLLSREGATVKPIMCTPGGADGISVYYLFKNFIVSCMYVFEFVFYHVNPL